MKPDLKPVDPKTDQLIVVDQKALERIDDLIERLLDLRNMLDGDIDRETDGNTDDASFPKSPLYPFTINGYWGKKNSPGDEDDAEEEPDEDADGA